ncbi:MAG: alpha/beta hydrolase [Deltaproteobacteria bacterium]|jgi:pimeloyl-ACP methyl ester carboxylesterase|nr:alpha/beta hydrolase [Deltaproteobacteria bacterium]MBK8714809.1 alpha/beta hydrolase [Deltaproteobacteria bacterium]
MNRSRTSSFARAGALAATLLLGLGASGCTKRQGVAFAQIKYPVDTTTVAVGTAKIAVHDTGKGERTLVLIHGLGSSMPAWQRNIDALAQRYRVVAIDLPGYGKSTKGNYAYSMAFFAQAVRGVVRELQLGRVTLVGHSMGGQIAMTYALDYPEDVEALVLTSPAGLEAFEDGEARWLAGTVTPEFTCAADAEAVWLRHTQNFHRTPKAAEFMVRDRLAVVGGPDFQAYCMAVSRSVAGMIDGPVLHRLHDLDLPTLVLFGNDDGLIPNPFLHGGSTERLAKKAVAQMPDAELVMLEKAGHMAQFEAAEQWNQAVLRFLADTKEPGAPRQRRGGGAPVGTTIEPLYTPGTDPDARDDEAAAPVEPVPAPAPAPAPVPGDAAPPAEDPTPATDDDVTIAPVAARSPTRPGGR